MPKAVVDLHPFLASLNQAFYGSEAFGISESGIIVGSAYDAMGNSFAAMWTPIPEPTTGALVIFVVAIMAQMRTHPYAGQHSKAHQVVTERHSSTIDGF
jgi:hypothetical protein